MDNTISYRIDEAVKVSGIGRSKLYEIIKKGDLPAIRLGRRTLIRSDHLKTFIENLPRHKIP